MLNEVMKTTGPEKELYISKGIDGKNSKVCPVFSIILIECTSGENDGTEALTIMDADDTIKFQEITRGN